MVRHLGDGRCWDEQRQAWRDGRGRQAPSPALLADVPVRTTKVVLAASVIRTVRLHGSDAGK
jgi:hypothetical protein